MTENKMMTTLMKADSVWKLKRESKYTQKKKQKKVLVTKKKKKNFIFVKKKPKYKVQKQ